jgi:GTP-binding protein
LKVLTAEFVTSAAAQGRADGIPDDGLAQVAFAGRSNVGKSTLLNALAHRKLARTSAAPGKTRLANIFRLQVEGGPGGPGRWSVYFVDLPGYGYARGGHDSAEELAAVAASYFRSATPGPTPVLRPVGPPVARHFSGAAETETETQRPRSDAALKSGATGASGATGRGTKRATLLLVDSRHPGLESDLQAHRWLTTVAAPPQIVATKIDKLSRSDRGKNLKALERIFGMTPLPVSAAGGEGLDELWRLIARVAREQRP